MVVHANVASLESFKAKVRGELGDTTTLKVQSQVIKDKDHSKFFLTPKPKPMIN